MRRSSRLRSLTGSILGLFGTKKPNITFINRKNEYYRNYYFPKQLCDGIDMVSAVELCSKKAAVEMLMKAGLSSYMGAKISKYIHDEKIAREHNQKVEMTSSIHCARRPSAKGNKGSYGREETS